MRPRFAVVSLAFLLFAAAPPLATPCLAALHAGDVLVASTVYNQGGPWILWQLSSATRDTTRLSTGGLLRGPSQIALSLDGGVLVADEVSGLVRIDPATGAQQLLASPASLGGDPAGVLVAETGGIYLSVSGAGTGSVVEVDATGALVRTVTSGDHLQSPAALAMAPSGEMYVAERLRPGTFPDPYGSIVRIDPSSGTQELLVSGGYMYGPHDLALTPSGLLYAAHRGTLSGRQAVFTRTSITDGATDRDPEVGHLVSYYVAANGTDDPIMNWCSTISYTCYTPQVSRRSEAIFGPGSPPFAGPMLVVPAGATPARQGTWGSLKLLHR